MRRLKNVAQTARDFVYRVLYRGTGRWCPVCEKPSRRFRAFGVDERRDDAMCVNCGALERHRFLWLFFQKMTNLFTTRGQRMLHVAPERCFEPRLRRRLGPSYLTADLDESRAQVQMDITRIAHPDDSFDVIYCSHVLEHVPDDRRALREFRRILKPTGWAVILVPITAAATVEDASVTDPKERFHRFGQKDHFRRYGPDFVERLREAGFNVQVTRVADVASPEEATLMGLMEGTGDIYYCTK